MMMRRTARVLAASVGVAAAVTVAAPAHALPQSPQVTVFGTALCPSTDPANRLTISTGFETKNALPDPESGSYSVTFNQIPPTESGRTPGSSVTTGPSPRRSPSTGRRSVRPSSAASGDPMTRRFR